MAKRFTATDKWEDPWFRALKPAQKLLWIYMLDRCDLAGVLELDVDLAEFCIGGKISPEALAGRAIPLSGLRYWIPKFIEFQYGCAPGDLNEHSPIHSAVLKIIKKYDLLSLLSTLSIPSISPSDRAKDKRKDKDKDKSKDTPPEGKAYAENVRMTEEEFGRLKDRLKSEARAKRCIEILDNAKGAKGYKYKSDYRAILTWVVGELEKREAAEAKNSTPKVGLSVAEKMRKCEKCGELFSGDILHPKCYPRNGIRKQDVEKIVDELETRMDAT